MIIVLTGGCGKAEQTTTEEVVATEETIESSPTDAFLNVYMDDYALDIVKEACQARWDKSFELESDFDYIENNYIYTNGRFYGEFHWLGELYEQLNQIEYNVLCKYTHDNFNDRKFKDAKLKSYMVAYAESVEKQLEIGKHTDFSISEENDKYLEYVSTKCQSVTDIMDDYELKFDSEYISCVEEYKNPVDEE